jgi:hypothetical protein
MNRSTNRTALALFAVGFLALIALGVYVAQGGIHLPGAKPEAVQTPPEARSTDCHLNDDGYIVCGGATPSADQSTSRPTVQTTEEKRAVVIAEARSAGRVDNLSDEEIWALATKTCNQLDASRTWHDVRDSNDDVRAFQQDAVHILCPFHDIEVEFTQ